jgi:hypothetical protein
VRGHGTLAIKYNTGRGCQFYSKGRRNKTGGMRPIILVRDPQMKRARLYGLHPASVPVFCGQFRFCGHIRNVFRECERYIETAFARFQNAYRRYREDGPLFPDRCRSQHSAPSVRFSLEHSSLCFSAKKSYYSKRLRKAKSNTMAR